MRGCILLLLVILVPGCDPNSTDDIVIESPHGQMTILLRAEGTVNYLQCHVNDSLTSSWPLRYPVFKIIKGDVNNDGVEDLAVGVIKPTRRDPTARKRLFLFQIRNGSIIPLWLGSSLSHPMEDFSLYKNGSRFMVRSIEVEKSGRYLVAEYEWFGFGLTFRKYLHRELPLSQAGDLLDQ
jgi:hypothetical protein